MITYVQRQLWRGAVATNTDKVFAALAIPRGGVFHGCNFEISLHQLEQDVQTSVMYAISGYSVPILNPGAATSFDTVWEAQVPKAVSQGALALDLDTETADATPEYEPGLVNWAGVYDMESGPKRLYRKRKLVTMATVGGGVAATGTMTHYLPKDRFTMSVSGGGRARVPTAIMFALSSPVMDETTTAVLTLPTEAEWMQLQFLEDTALDALKFLLGGAAAGTQEVYSEAAIFLDKTLAPNPFEEAASRFGTGTWEVAAQGSFTSSVPGKMTVGALDGDK